MRALLILFVVALALFIGGALLRDKARLASTTLFALSAFIVVFFALAVSGVL